MRSKIVMPGVIAVLANWNVGQVVNYNGKTYKVITKASLAYLPGGTGLFQYKVKEIHE